MKKKWSILLSMALCFGLLVGCAEETSVENEEMTLTFSYGERTGKYTGEVQNGIPNGYGKFESANEKGTNWTYEGSFANGLFEGEGKTTWEDGTWQAGDYKAGDWQQNQWGLIATMEGMGTITSTSDAIVFMKENKNLFPAENAENLGEYLDESVEYKMIIKEPQKYGATIVKLDNLYVNQIQTFQPATDVESKSTYFIAFDDDFNVYEFYMAQELPDVYAGDTLSVVYGIPVNTNSYEAASGGFVNSLVIAPCLVQK